MHIFVIVILAVMFGLILSRGQVTSSSEGDSRVSGTPVPERNYVPLRTEEDREIITLKGVDYFAVEGELSEASEAPVWDWHGRMGEGVGYLLREGALFPDGELYTLRGRRDILLAYLPGGGWPIDDMGIFLPSGVTLPAVRADGFSSAEIFRIRGEFPEEEYEKIGENTDFSWISALARAWLEGETSDAPEGEYERFRVRLYSSEIPGVYVNVNVYANRDLRCIVAEKYRFGGETLLPMAEFSAFLD